MNDLLTQGLLSDTPIAFLTQGLIGEISLFVVEYLSIVLSFQTSVMAIAVANPSIEILSPFNNISLDVANNKIEVDVLKQAIDLSINDSQVTLNAINSSRPA